MESLLHWGIANSSANADGGASTSASGITPRQDFDPAILDHILGRPDAELMKEALAKAQDKSLHDDARVQALDDLEMLVEHIDNASDLERLQMWAPIHAFLTTPDTSDELKTQALWVIGTAVQNNPTAQRAYLSLQPPPLPVVLSFLQPSVRSPVLRSKAVYTLSSLLKHNRAAMSALDEAGGWSVLRAALQDSNIAVRRKLTFLLNTLIMPYNTDTLSSSTTLAGTVPNIHGGVAEQVPVHANSHAAMIAEPGSAATAWATLDAFRKHEILLVLVRELASPTPVLHTYAVTHAGEFEEKDGKALREYFEARGAETYGLDEGEKQDLVRILAK
ncbi:Fes1-domain-containing protein [Vararia minispora EC-137]|uniref:Fes1-domain-containing protein n=1 Tax=Vararia minispora EC-137 TaxID=1314806 RepID=A0ACB8QLV4_9AGAM|nr:Fes1-domain-containing protein [Vararia minispora EC-137]